MDDEVYNRFKDYEKVFREPQSKILFPPEIYNEIVRNIKGTVLDIGTADGYKLENILQGTDLRQINKVVAIDPSPLYKKAEERLRKFGSVKIYNLCIEDFNSEEKFDIILMFDIIEHLFDPKKDLYKIIDLLKPNGTFICSTPNKWVFRITEKIGGKDQDPTHINEMTYKQFVSLTKSYFQEVKYMGVLPIMTIGRKYPKFFTLNRYFGRFLPILKTIYCFAKDPIKSGRK